MMNKITMISIVIVFSVVGFIGGTYYGFKEGVKNFSLLETIVQGALSRHHLAYLEKSRIGTLEKNRIGDLEHLFELKIDTGLHRYVIYRESGNKLLSDYFMPEATSELDRYVDLMADYRKNHPIVFNADWAKPVEGDDEATRLWKEQDYKESVEMLSEIKKLLIERGVPETALINQGAQAQ